MKIVFTVYTYFPLKDGVQAITQSHAEGLVKKGHEVTVITTNHNNLEKYDIVNGVKIIRVDIETKHAIHRGNKSNYRQIIMRECEDCDVLINVCTQIVSTDWVFKILNELRCKKVLYMHGMIDFKWKRNDFRTVKNIASKLWNSLRWGLYYLYIPTQIKKYDLIINLHEFDKFTKFCKNKKINKYKIIENGINESEWENLDKKKTSDKDYFICISNYIQGKNQEFVLKAFYRTKSCKSKLIFMGSSKTNYLYRLKNLKEKYDKLYGYRNIEFLYDIDRALVPTYLDGAKGFLNGSIHEVFPMVIIEAMQSGIPFISTNVGCVSFLPGGIIVKDIEEMSYWIDMLEDNIEVANLLGRAGKVYVKSHLKQEYKLEQLEKYITNI